MGAPAKTMMMAYIFAWMPSTVNATCIITFEQQTALLTLQFTVGKQMGQKESLGGSIPLAQKEASPPVSPSHFAFPQWAFRRLSPRSLGLGELLFL